jgi:hypothetical protein
MYARRPISVRQALYPLELKIRAIRQRRLDNTVRRSMSQVFDAVAARAPVIRKYFFVAPLPSTRGILLLTTFFKGTRTSKWRAKTDWPRFWRFLLGPS